MFDLNYNSKLSNEVEMGVSSGVVENACSKDADVIIPEELIKQQKM